MPVAGGPVDEITAPSEVVYCLFATKIIQKSPTIAAMRQTSGTGDKTLYRSL
jgi:hypothetical protein